MSILVSTESVKNRSRTVDIVPYNTIPLYLQYLLFVKSSVRAPDVCVCVCV